jgi:hypothetical protein
VQSGSGFDSLTIESTSAACDAIGDFFDGASDAGFNGSVIGGLADLSTEVS